MKPTKFILIIVLSVLTMACGGGGGGGGDSTSTSSSPAPTDVTDSGSTADEGTDDDDTDDSSDEETDIDTDEAELTPDPDAVYNTTAELVVAKSFLINAEYSVNINFENEEGRNTYLSVCTDFTEGANMEVDYDSCILRTSTETSYSTTLTVANDKNSILMAIWYLDDMENPRYEIWENDPEDDSEKTFEVN